MHSNTGREPGTGGESDENTLPLFANADFFVQPDSVTLGPLIGEGTFSSVYIGKYFGDIVAVKKQTRQGKYIEKHLLRELAVLKFIRHEHMLEYIGAYDFISKTRGQLHSVYIVTEYAWRGDFLKLLLSNQLETSLGWHFRVRVAMEIASALGYLHSQGLIHRDIKSSNVLLDRQWRCKLSDFGMTRPVSKSGRMTICGTDEYMAPELLFDEGFSYPADMFSLGMVLLEVLTRKKVGRDGFATRTPVALFILDMETIMTEMPVAAPYSLVHLMKLCLAQEPRERPNAIEARKWLEDLLEALPKDGEQLPSLPEVHWDFEEKDDSLISSSSVSPASKTKTMPISREDVTPPRAKAIQYDHSVNQMKQKDYQRQDVKSSPSPLINQPKGSSGSLLQYRPPPSLMESRDSIGSSSGIYIPSKMGYLHVKNQGIGFRNWKKRWFVLKGGDLVCYKDGGRIDTVDLLGCTIVRGHANQFKIVRLGPAGGKGGQDEMELSCADQNSLKAWLTAIQAGIDCVDEGLISLEETGGEKLNEMDNETIFSSQSMTHQIDSFEDGGDYSPENTVEEWLSNRGLSRYEMSFKKAGINDVEYLLQGRLSLPDLDKLGIKQPLIRRFLGTLKESKFIVNMHISIVGHRMFGDVTVYKVLTEWRAWCCKTDLLFTDFNKLHNKLRRTMKDGKSPLIERLLQLPGKNKVVQNYHDPAFLVERKRALESYLREVSRLILTEEPYFSILADSLALPI